MGGGRGGGGGRSLAFRYNHVWVSMVLFAEDLRRRIGIAHVSIREVGLVLAYRPQRILMGAAHPILRGMWCCTLSGRGYPDQSPASPFESKTTSTPDERDAVKVCWPLYPNLSFCPHPSRSIGTAASTILFFLFKKREVGKSNDTKSA